MFSNFPPPLNLWAPYFTCNFTWPKIYLTLRFSLLHPNFPIFSQKCLTDITWYKVCFGDNFGWSTCHKNLLTQIRREYIFLWSWKVLPIAYNKYIDWYLTLPSPLMWYLTLRYLTLRFLLILYNFPIFFWSLPARYHVV